MALEAARKARDRTAEASIQHSIGWIFFKQGHQAEAEQLLESSIQLYLDLEKKDLEGTQLIRTPSVVWAILCLAKIAIAQEDIDQGNAIIHQTRKMVTDNARAVFDRGSLPVKAHIEFKLGNYDDAKELMKLALDEAKKEVSGLSISTRWIDLGNIALEQNRLDEAKSSFLKGLESSRQFYRDDNIARAELGLIEVYARRREMTKAEELAISTRDKFVRLGMTSSVKKVDEILKELREEGDEDE